MRQNRRQNKSELKGEGGGERREQISRGGVGLSRGQSPKKGRGRQYRQTRDTTYKTAIRICHDMKQNLL